MFTRLSNFTYGNYKIANIEAAGVDKNLELSIHIQKCEEQCLRMILGDALYEDLMANVEKDGDGTWKLKENAAEKWGWLISGKSYTATGIASGCGYDWTGCVNNGWDGLVKKVATIGDKDVFESILAPYIFYYWSLNNRTIITGNGEGKGKADGTTQESTKHKRIDAWNEFAQSVYIGYPGCRVCLNQFLLEHPEDYPTAKLVSIGTMTYYDI